MGDDEGIPFPDHRLHPFAPQAQLAPLGEDPEQNVALGQLDGLGVFADVLAVDGHLLKDHLGSAKGDLLLVAALVLQHAGDGRGGENGRADGAQPEAGKDLFPAGGR